MKRERTTQDEFCVMQKVGRGKWEEVSCEDTLPEARAAMLGYMRLGTGHLYKIQPKRKPKRKPKLLT